MRNIAVAVAVAESGAPDPVGPNGVVDSGDGADGSAVSAADPALVSGGRSGAGRRRARGGPVGRRRAVGPVIGEQLAALLLQNHQADVLLAHQCACGQPFPCPSLVFATTFLGDQELLLRPAAPAPPATTKGATQSTSGATANSASATGDKAASANPKGGGAARRGAAHRAETASGAGDAAAQRDHQADLDSTQVLERIDPDAEPPASADEPQRGPYMDSTQEFQKIPPAIAV
jgi:hypothetical protein